MTTHLKTCTKCYQELPLSGFSRDRQKLDGYYSSCKRCAGHRVRNTSERNRTNQRYYLGTRARYYRENPLKYLWDVAQKRARKQGYVFSIEVEDIRVFRDKDGNIVCPILGVQLDVLTNDGQTGMSLDRIDNALGYIKGNVVVMSRKANRMKGDNTIESLRRILSLLEASA